MPPDLRAAHEANDRAVLAAASTIPHGAVSEAHASTQLIIRVNFL